MTKKKAIIIGCGKIAGLYDDVDDSYVYSHGKAYYINDNIDLAGCCDVDIRNAQKLSKKYNIPNFSDDYMDMVNLIKPDIISICTPDHTHYQVTVDILNSDYLPKIIFLEKPACQNIEQLNMLIETSRQKKVEIVVNHSRRFDALHKELKNIILKNKFGKLVKANIVYYSGWKHNGVHVVDTLNFLFNDKLIFEDLMKKTNAPYPNDYNLDFKCMLENNHALVYITTIDERYYQLFEFDFMFEKARVRIEDFGNRLFFEEKTVNGMSENVLVQKNLEVNLDSKSPMQSAVELIVERLNNNFAVKGYLIENIAPTMKMIWEGAEWAD